MKRERSGRWEIEKVTSATRMKGEGGPGEREGGVREQWRGELSLICGNLQWKLFRYSSNNVDQLKNLNLFSTESKGCKFQTGTQLGRHLSERALLHCLVYRLVQLPCQSLWLLLVENARRLALRKLKDS